MGKTLLRLLFVLQIIMVFGLFKSATKSGSSVVNVATAMSTSTLTSTSTLPSTSTTAQAVNAAAGDTGTCSSTSRSPSLLHIEDALRNALWAFFAGDALAMPTHWYYGGVPQIQRDYGRQNGITGYTKPVLNLPGSILNKSNINGGGRGSFRKTTSSDGKSISIIGDVINHGKLEYWNPNKEIHYHATLQRGENTLEAQLARVLMKCIVQDDGKFNADHFREVYVKFMMTPGSHNDTYASTCHRMFFANYVMRKLPLDQCPDNDHHNVDTIDGLVLPTITSLAMAARQAAKRGTTAYSLEDIEATAAATAAVTRQSAVLEKASRAWGRLVANALLLSSSSSNSDNDTAGTVVNNDTNLDEYLNECAKTIGTKRMPSSAAAQPDQMTACYLDSALPATLDMIGKYSSQLQQQRQQQQGTTTTTTPTATSSSVVWNALLSNANCGGENVHRGSILGAILGATQSHYYYSTYRSESNDGKEQQHHHQQQLQQLRNGLYHEAQLEQEIDDFVKAVLKK